MRSWFSVGGGVALGSLALFAGLTGLLYWISLPTNIGPSQEPLVIQCAEALRRPIEKIAQAFEMETGQPVEIRYNASQHLLNQIVVSKAGDVFIPADDSFLKLAREKNVIRETMPLATMTAVVVANPQAPAIKSWDDLVSGKVNLFLGNPDATAIGKVTRDVLVRSGRWAELEARKPVFQPKISDVGAAVLLDPKGVGIVFDAVAGQYPTLTVTRLPELDAIKAEVAVAVTAFTKQPTQALRFARFVSSKDRGLPVLKSMDYTVADNADIFVLRPELKLFGGTMLRPAIEETIREFERREGVDIATNWNGCGILVGEMKANKIPDIYFACEPRFMEKVQDLFGPPELVSSNKLVIAVRKGNPHGVKRLRDLAKDDLKVGVGNENQCALGDLTKTTFLRTGLYGAVRKNIAKEAPSGDLLISDFRGGALDVIVCYESNVTPYLNEFEFTPVDIGAENADCTNPLQPVAIARACAHPQLARRLMDAFQTPESKARFDKLGFGWVSKK